jgi:hypothetical protein
VDGADDKPGAVATLGIGGVHLGAQPADRKYRSQYDAYGPSLRWGRLLTFLAAS